MKYRMHNNDKPERLVACVIEAVGGIRKAMGHVYLEQSVEEQLRALRQLQGVY
jgi:hypothetical protein